jgi:hypothetical protein
MDGKRDQTSVVATEHPAGILGMDIYRCIDLRLHTDRQLGMCFFF